MAEPEINDLIERYFNGNCSEKEKILLERFYDSFETDASSLSAAERNELKKKIFAGIKEQVGDLKQVKKKKYTKFTYAAAAVAFICLISVGILYKSGFFTGKSVLPNWNEKLTIMGEKASIKLADGTDVLLNAGSKLTYPGFFNGAKREVYLEGEAYFEVAKDSAKPFIIRSSNLKVTVLGTKFNINSFNEEDKILVSLVEGKVSVAEEYAGMQKSLIILQPQQQLIYDKEGQACEVEYFDQQKAIGWKNNILKFEKEPLNKIFPILERTFGVKFELADNKLSSQKVTVNFKNDSFWTVASVLKNLTGLKYKTIKKGDKIEKIVFYK